MGKLLYSENIGFDMSDWEKENIQKVFAGTNCIMALTVDGRVLQKAKDPSVAARTRYWNNITAISLSNWANGLAIGLVTDGTCMIAKKPLRKLCDNMGCSYDFNRINDTVKSWKNIVAVAASDAFFALDAFGRVHYATLGGLDDYGETKNWENIVRIVTGSQCSVFGIDADGHVHVAGHNCLRGSMGDLNLKFANMNDIVDLCVSGSECGTIYVAHRDGTVENLCTGEKLPILCCAEPGVMGSHTTGVAIQEASGTLRFLSYCYDGILEETVFGDIPVSSFSLGDVQYGPSFVIAVASDR